MARFDVDKFFNETDEETLARARKNMERLKRNDTRSPAEIAKYKEGRAESRQWAAERAVHEKEAMDKRIGGMSQEQKGEWLQQHAPDTWKRLMDKQREGPFYQ